MEDSKLPVKIEVLCAKLNMSNEEAFKAYRTDVIQNKEDNLTYIEWLERRANITDVDKLCKEIGASREALEKCFKFDVMSRNLENITFLEWLEEAKEKGYNPLNCTGPDLKDGRGGR